LTQKGGGIRHQTGHLSFIVKCSFLSYELRNNRSGQVEYRMMRVSVKLMLDMGLAVVVGLSGVAIGAYQAGGGVSRQPILKEKKVAPAHRLPHAGECVGGAERIARVELVPDAIVSEGSRRWVEYHSDITVNKATGAGVSWESDVINDRGQIVVQHLSKDTTNSMTAKTATTVTTGTIAASSLADGFYTLRVRAAVS
jgi:hypothetical protein